MGTAQQTPASKCNQVIAIDGPAASGKSSVARAVASRLGFVHLNTGEMYRAATWLALRDGIDPANCEALSGKLDRTGFELKLGDGSAIFELDGTPASQVATAEGVAENVSLVARCLGVRKRLVDCQRQFATLSDLVVEGRDIGSVVFPETPYKFYIDADPEIRNARRRKQGLPDVIADRDAMDRERAVSPLQAAPGACRIDTTHLSLEAVIEQVCQHLAATGLAAALSLSSGSSGQ